MFDNRILLDRIRLQRLAFYHQRDVSEERKKHNTGYTQIQDRFAPTIHFFHTFVFKLSDRRIRLSHFCKRVFEHPLF